MAKINNGTVVVEFSPEEFAVIKKSVEKSYDADLLYTTEDRIARSLLRDFGVDGYEHG